MGKGDSKVSGSSIVLEVDIAIIVNKTVVKRVDIIGQRKLQSPTTAKIIFSTTYWFESSQKHK